MQAYTGMRMRFGSYHWQCPTLCLSLPVKVRNLFKKDTCYQVHSQCRCEVYKAGEPNNIVQQPTMSAVMFVTQPSSRLT